MPQQTNFSTKNIDTELLNIIAKAIQGKAYGSVEIYIQNFRVTQVTEREITKLPGNQIPRIKSSARSVRRSTGADERVN